MYACAVTSAISWDCSRFFAYTYFLIYRLWNGNCCCSAQVVWLWALVRPQLLLPAVFPNWKNVDLWVPRKTYEGSLRRSCRNSVVVVRRNLERRPLRWSSPRWIARRGTVANRRGLHRRDPAAGVPGPCPTRIPRRARRWWTRPRRRPRTAAGAGRSSLPPSRLTRSPTALASPSGSSSPSCCPSSARPSRAPPGSGRSSSRCLRSAVQWPALWPPASAVDGPLSLERWLRVLAALQVRSPTASVNYVSRSGSSLGLVWRSSTFPLSSLSRSTSKRTEPSLPVNDALLCVCCIRMLYICNLGVKNNGKNGLVYCRPIFSLWGQALKESYDFRKIIQSQICHNILFHISFFSFSHYA